MHQIGPYQVSVLVTDRFRLDGGAMFGSVPKILWQRRIASDESNRIQLACRILVLRSADRVILVDVGMGRKWSEKDKEIYAIEYLDPRPLGDLVPGVTDVVLTHLHFDHAGGISVRDGASFVLQFPEATVYVQRENLRHAQNPGVRERASYLRENVIPVSQAKLVLMADGDEALPGIRGYVSNGHTHGLQWIVIGQGRGAVAYPADLMPTSHHLGLPYVMGYDLCAETSMKEKEAFLVRAIDEEWIVVFEHDAEVPAATLKFNDRGQAVIKDIISL